MRNYNSRERKTKSNSKRISRLEEMRYLLQAAFDVGLTKDISMQTGYTPNQLVRFLNKTNPGGAGLSRIMTATQQSLESLDLKEVA